MGPIGGAVLGLRILESFRYGSNTSCLRDGSSGFASGMRTWDAADMTMPPFAPLSRSLHVLRERYETSIYRVRNVRSPSGKG